MELGEHWAYRARRIDPLVEVEVKRHGTQKPARVLVRFIGDDAEGREEWVPPARLKVRWPEVEELRAREARWEAVDTHPGLNDAREEYAVDEVMRKLVDEALATPEYRYAGVTRILDTSGLARLLQIDETVLRAEAVAFEEEGALIVPWATTELIVRRACELFPEPILREVEMQEEKARQEAMHGSTGTSVRGSDQQYFIEPETAATWDAEAPFGKAMRDLLREWCGQEAVDRRDELTALRKEVVRIGGLLSDAIHALRRAGEKAQAESLARQFGVPLPEARASKR